MKGETSKSVANGHNNVTDLEVYLVKGGNLIVIIVVFFILVIIKKNMALLFGGRTTLSFIFV